MSILDFGLCDAIRFAFSGEEPGGFNNIKKVLDLDHVYTRANQLITFIDNHDMPRFLSVTDSVQNLELATVLLLTLRGIPCIFYGTEQYLVNNTNGGGDPYNRPMMDSWDLNNSLIKIIQKLSKLRSTNPALTFGSFQENFINESIFSYTRKHRGFKVFTLINQGNDTILNLKYLDMNYLGKIIPPMGGQVKRAVMETSCTSGTPKFSRMSGIQKWKNCIQLFVNVYGNGYKNVFLNGGKQITVSLIWSDLDCM